MSFILKFSLLIARHSTILQQVKPSSIIYSITSTYGRLAQSTYNTTKLADLLTHEERTAYSRLFKEMDQDNDGIISKAELKQGLHDFIGYDASESELDESLLVLDKNRDGKVDIQDFLHHMEARKKETRLEAIRFTFEMWDSNADGFIERSDLKNLLKAVGENPTNTKIDKILDASDYDKDGRLSFKEFRDIFKYKQF